MDSLFYKQGQREAAQRLGIPKTATWKNYMGTMAGGAVGTGLGAWADEDNRLRGAAIGGLLGVGAGFTGDLETMEQAAQHQRIMDSVKTMTQEQQVRFQEKVRAAAERAARAGEAAAQQTDNFKVGFTTPGRAIAGHALLGGALGAGAGYGLAGEDNKLLGTSLGALSGAALGGAGKAGINRLRELDARDANHYVDAMTAGHKEKLDQTVGDLNAYLDKLQRSMDAQPHGTQDVWNMKNIYDATMEDRHKAEAAYKKVVKNLDKERVPEEALQAKQRGWL